MVSLRYGSWEGTVAQSGGQEPPEKERTWHQGGCRASEGVGDEVNNISQPLQVDFQKTLPHYALCRALCCPFRINAPKI